MKIEELCEQKERELLDKYFGELVEEAAVKRPETIGRYTKELPLEVEAQYREYLEGLWAQYGPEGQPLVFDEQRLRRLITEDDREMIDAAHKAAERRTLWERISRSNHQDVTFYKGLLHEYTRELLMVMRLDFLEEITGRHIRNKTFEAD